jgi:hypothetical protein
MVIRLAAISASPALLWRSSLMIQPLSGFAGEGVGAAGVGVPAAAGGVLAGFSFPLFFLAATDFSLPPRLPAPDGGLLLSFALLRVVSALRFAVSPRAGLLPVRPFFYAALHKNQFSHG